MKKGQLALAFAVTDDAARETTELRLTASETTWTLVLIAFASLAREPVH